jgi:acetylornithine/succinyldiaminopimelate/putrescine aminotransferase
MNASGIRDLERFLLPLQPVVVHFPRVGPTYSAWRNRYLDMLGGIAVNSLGYNHPRIVRVLTEQGRNIIHCSNLFYHAFQGQLAERLCQVSGMAQVFFTNSGTEAIEAALKIARAYGHIHGGPGKSRILTLRNSFHGRTWRLTSPRRKI